MTLDTGTLRDQLRAHYPAPEWTLVFEVQADRDEGGLCFADAIAFNTRKSSSLPTHGFELKISRGDWLNEVRKPGKNAANRKLCDYWWIVAGEPGIVKLDELPEGTGLLEFRGGKLIPHRPALRNGATHGHVVNRNLMAAVLRRLLNPDAHPAAYYAARERAAERRGYNKGRNEAGRVARKRERQQPSAPTLPDGQFCP